MSIDGKTLRHSFDHGTSKAAIHMVSPWANTNRLVVGQLQAEANANEITVISSLLALLDPRGSSVTMDAMGCQKDMAWALTAQGVDYVLALKENPPTLYEDVTLWVHDAKAHSVGQVAYPCEETVDADYSGLDVRIYWMTSALEWLGVKASWANLQRWAWWSRGARGGAGHAGNALLFDVTSLRWRATCQAGARTLGARCLMSRRRVSDSQR